MDELCITEGCNNIATFNYKDKDKRKNKRYKFLSTSLKTKYNKNKALYESKNLSTYPLI